MRNIAFAIWVVGYGGIIDAELVFREYHHMPEYPPLVVLVSLLILVGIGYLLYERHE